MGLSRFLPVTARSGCPGKSRWNSFKGAMEKKWKIRLLPEDIIDYTSNGVIVADSDGLIVLINAGASRLLGLDSASAVGKDIRNVLPSAGEKVLRCLDTSLAELGQIRIRPKLAKSWLISRRFPPRVAGPKGLSLTSNPCVRLRSLPERSISSIHSRLFAKHLETIFEHLPTAYGSPMRPDESSP